MKRLAVFDPAMCCSTGVRGPNVDPVLVRFAADVKWLQEQGVEVQRFNLSQSPAAFVENEQVKRALTEKDETALPFLLVDGQVLASGHYRERSQLTVALGVTSGESSIFSPAVAELIALGADELSYIREVSGKCSKRTAIVPWVAEEPVGPEKLRQLFQTTNLN